MLLHSRNYSKPSIKLFNHTPQSYEVQIIIIIVQMKKNWGQELSGYSSKLLSMNMSPHNMEVKCLSVNFMTIQSSQLKII